jgi:hypothetical protein
MDQIKNLNDTTEFSDTLEVILNKDLRLLPLNIVITEIYDSIIYTASRGKLSIDFCIEDYLSNISLDLLNIKNNNIVLNELKQLFPEIEFTQIGLNSYNDIVWKACWENDIEDVAINGFITYLSD